MEDAIYPDREMREHTDDHKFAKFLPNLLRRSPSRVINPGGLLYVYYDWHITRIQLSVDTAMNLHHRNNNISVPKAYKLLSLTSLYISC